MKRKFETVKKDYLDLIEKWGHPNDMTGGFVDAEEMEKVILNPTKAGARDYMESVIKYGFQEHNETYYSENYGKVSIYECELLELLYNEYIN